MRGIRFRNHLLKPFFQLGHDFGMILFPVVAFRGIQIEVEELHAIVEPKFPRTRSNSVELFRVEVEEVLPGRLARLCREEISKVEAVDAMRRRCARAQSYERCVEIQVVVISALLRPPSIFFGQCTIAGTRTPPS